MRDRIQALYDRLLATMQTLDVNKEISPESVTIYQKAEPALADRPELSKQLAVGGVAGLFVGVLLLWFVDRLDDRLDSFTELQDLFDEDVVGQIPRERNGRGKPLALIEPERFPPFSARSLPQPPVLSALYGGGRRAAEGAAGDQLGAQ